MLQLHSSGDTAKLPYFEHVASVGVDVVDTTDEVIVRVVWLDPKV